MTTTAPAVMRGMGIPDPRVLVQTEAFVRALGKAERAVELRCIGSFDGPAGTGKTTAITSYCALSGHRAAMTVIPDEDTPKQGLAKVYRSFFGTRANKSWTRDDIYEELFVGLRNGKGRVVLVVDEAQNLGLRGLNQLQYLHDESAKQGHPFALLLVGYGVERTITKSTPLESRRKVRCTFSAITDERLLPDLCALDARLAATDPALIHDIDRSYCHGNLRKWTTFLDNADLEFRSTTEPAGGFTAKEADKVLRSAGMTDEETE